MKTNEKPADKQGTKQKSKRLGQVLAEAVDTIGVIIQNLIKGFEDKPLPHETVEVLGYDDAIRWFLRNKKEAKGAKKGVMVKQVNAKGTLTIYSVFLDREDKQVLRETGEPFCRAVQAAKLDDELAELFADGDFVEIGG
ncbi:MAG: hypothetical protein LBG73_01400 [Spirochaetaceae bacterium]|jgi:hypothetical protein|nr:hypothetical protein [Spirochaetaceae bacterium]